MKNLNLFFQLSTITSMLVAGLFTFSVAQNADDQSTNKKLTIDIEVIENGEVTKITKEVDAANGESIHEILKELDIMDDLDISGTGERVEIRVKKEIRGEVETDVDVEVLGHGDDFHWYGKEAKCEKKPLLGVYPATYEADGVIGAIINDVVEGSAAEKASLKKDDIITSVNDVAITSDKRLRDVVQSHKIGESVSVTYLRDGVESTKDVVLGSNNQENVFIHRMAPNGGNRFFFDGEFDSEEMMKHLKEVEKDMHFDFDVEIKEDGAFLGVTSGECDPGEKNGVLIGRVVEGSAAEKMGLQAGDRIFKLDNEPVNSFDELAAVISSKNAGDNLDVEYKRAEETLTSNGALGDRSESQQRVIQKRFNYNPHCDVGAGNGPWALDVVKEVNVVIEMKDCSEEEEEMLAAPAKVDFEEDLSLNKIEFSPNPNNGQFNLEFELPEQRATRILVFDQMGRNVHEEMLSNFDGRYKDQIDISAQPNGVYFLIIAQGEKQFTRKIVKQ